MDTSATRALRFFYFLFIFFLMSGTGADLDMLATDLIDTSAGYYTYPVSGLGFRVVIINNSDTSAAYYTYAVHLFRSILLVCLVFF